MKTMRSTLVGTAVLLGLSCQFLAANFGGPSAGDVIEKAIDTAGGERALSRVKAAFFKGKGVYSLEDLKGAFKVVGIIQPPNQEKLTIEVEIEGKTARQVIVVNGNEGWIKRIAKECEEENTEKMNEDELAETKSTMGETMVIFNPLTLRDKTISVSILDEQKVDDRPCLGIRAVQGKLLDLLLHFDKQTGRLKKVQRSEYFGLIPQKIRIDLILSDHKDVSGVSIPFKITSQREGQTFRQFEITELRLVSDHVGDEAFKKP